MVSKCHTFEFFESIPNCKLLHKVKCLYQDWVYGFNMTDIVVIDSKTLQKRYKTGSSI